MIRSYLIFIFSFCFSLNSQAQSFDNQEIKKFIDNYKKDPKGPYKDIRWFCKDGTFLPPGQNCPEIGAPQRARYKDDVVALAKARGIYLGQILASTPQEEFLDKPNYFSRMKQYQLEKYLKGIDNGWINRRAQFYRGSVQSEDEEAWGINFLTWVLGNDENVNQWFFMIREAMKDIPHRGDDNRMQNIRAVSKVLSDSIPAFLDLRVKIHGQPDVNDIQKVKDFRTARKGNLKASLDKQFDELIKDMEFVYQPVDLESLNKLVQTLPANHSVRSALLELSGLSTGVTSQVKVTKYADLIFMIRQELLAASSPQRLALMDLSIKLENLMFNEAANWFPETPADLIAKNYQFSKALVGTGHLELWEWEQLNAGITPPAKSELTIQELNDYLVEIRKVVEWGSGIVRATYDPVIHLYEGFEPMSTGFFDDRIRSSLLLPLGTSVGEISDFISRESSLTNKVLTIGNQGHIRGINPGYAKGELVVISESPEDIEVSRDKIYVFQRPPSDLKPVSGIMTVTEGNLVSHVQLLARNLGIPNAVVSNQNLDDLKLFSGQEIFYAVSPKGTVIMKPVAEMTPEEETLFAVKQRSNQKVIIEVDKMQLDNPAILDMSKIKADASGILCGPKAANLGQLNYMFPDKVVEGLVIPFSIFKQHMEQAMPGKNQTYWEFLNGVFERAVEMRSDGTEEPKVDKFVLGELSKLRDEIKKMPFREDFINNLKADFQQILGAPIGQVPVFLRSDTNMEDLKEFTGAGLNLTLFNVREEEKILKGILDVWASPYTERSYKWRQSYLLNPENVYPSILIIPSVDVDYSGVLITKGVINGNADDLTIAFSRGAGGAVDGQSAESYLLKSNGETELISPAREAFFNRLPEAGGTKKGITSFNQPIMNEQNIREIRELAQQVNEILPNAEGVETSGPFDIELGFKDNKLWLFQVRPFVENKNALTTEYLQSISPDVDNQKVVDITLPLN
ncbi:MAG: PEP/pyruvate-binding domain-containing protein [Cyclobacteriaceae bacterium]